MSYSICLKCKEAVESYEKYCRECQERYKQDRQFWANNNAYDFFQSSEKRNAELKMDLKE
jgi:predicted amidophosphoribosyltransferase